MPKFFCSGAASAEVFFESCRQVAQRLNRQLDWGAVGLSEQLLSPGIIWFEAPRRNFSASMRRSKSP